MKYGNHYTGFDIHGSVHLGNVYVLMKVQLDAHGYYVFFIPIY
jgi:tyrosyl-tRNA synthetase